MLTRRSGLARVAVCAAATLLVTAVFVPRPTAAQVPAAPPGRLCIQIYPPPPGCGSAGGSISTDQSQYSIGSPIQICYTVPGPGPITITDNQPGRLSHTLLSVYDDGTGWCFGATITPPSGTECLLLNYGGGSAQTCFQVGGSTQYESGCRQVSLADDRSTVTLVSGQCLLLNLDSFENWTVSVDDASILSCDSQFTSSGTCTSLSPGSTVLHATGNPPCYPRCLPPSRLFELYVTVQP